jgi:hypothetical protein
MQSSSELDKAVPFCRWGARIGGLRRWQQRRPGKTKRPIYLGPTSTREINRRQLTEVLDLIPVLSAKRAEAMSVTPGDVLYLHPELSVSS